MEYFIWVLPFGQELVFPAGKEQGHLVSRLEFLSSSPFMILLHLGLLGLREVSLGKEAQEFLSFPHLTDILEDTGRLSFLRLPN